MKETSPYSRKDLRRAVNSAAILGWLAIVGPALFTNPFILPLAAVFGLPIAFATCWAIGAPILRRLMRNTISWLAVGAWGGVIASFIAAISIVIGRYQGWRQSLNPNFYSQIGGGEFVRSVDGILSPYRWWILAQNTMQFILLGIVIGLIIRWRIGQGVQANRRAN
jgi:hypothetical protein